MQRCSAHFSRNPERRTRSSFPAGGRRLSFDVQGDSGVVSRRLSAIVSRSRRPHRIVSSESSKERRDPRMSRSRTSGSRRGVRGPQSSSTAPRRCGVASGARKCSKAWPTTAKARQSSGSGFGPCHSSSRESGTGSGVRRGEGAGRLVGLMGVAARPREFPKIVDERILASRGGSLGPPVVLRASRRKSTRLGSALAAERSPMGLVTLTRSLPARALPGVPTR